MTSEPQKASLGYPGKRLTCFPGMRSRPCWQGTVTACGLAEELLWCHSARTCWKPALSGSRESSAWGGVSLEVFYYTSPERGNGIRQWILLAAVHYRSLELEKLLAKHKLGAEEVVHVYCKSWVPRGASGARWYSNLHCRIPVLNKLSWLEDSWRSLLSEPPEPPPPAVPVQQPPLTQLTISWGKSNI